MSAAMVDDVNAVLGGKQEMDALTLIAWIRKILAQPHDERNLDAYVELIRQLCKARNAVLALVEGEAVAIRAAAQVSTPWGLPLGTGGEDGTIARARRGGFAHEMVRDGDNKEALLVLVRVHGQDELFLALELSPFDRNRVNEIVIRCMLVADLGERGAGGGAEHGVEIVDGSSGCGHQSISTLALMPGRTRAFVLSNTMRASISPLAGSAAGDTKLYWPFCVVVALPSWKVMTVDWPTLTLADCASGSAIFR